MKKFCEAPIGTRTIALVGRGPSVHGIHRSEWIALRDRCYVIGINDAPCISHLRVWMDPTGFDALKTWKKVGEYMTTDSNRDKEQADYLFQQDGPGLNGTNSLLNTLQLCRWWFPANKVVLMGVDFQNDDDHCPFFDENGNKIKTEQIYDYLVCLPAIRNKVERFAAAHIDWARNVVIHGNSALTCFAKVNDWREHAPVA